MASPYSYTTRRRMLMQGAMVGVLAGTLGLAALVQRSRTTSEAVTLSSPVGIGLYEIALPEGWTTKRRWLKQIPPFPSIEAIDPKGGRVFTASQRFLDYDVTAEKYLETFHEIDEQTARLTPVEIDNQKALAAVVVTQRQGPNWVSTMTHQFAVLVAPDRRTVLEVELESPGSSTTAADRRTFRDVVASIRRKPGS